MPIDLILKTLLGLSPVLLLLAVLVHLDSWKLVDFATVLKMLLTGAVLATAASLVNGAALGHADLGLSVYGRYVAPIVEESLKAGALIYLFIRNRIGFKITKRLSDGIREVREILEHGMLLNPYDPRYSNI